MKHKVLITDYQWTDIEIEKEVLAQADAEPVVATTGEEAEFIELAADADAILTCWKNVTAAVLDNAPKCLMVSRYGVGVDNIDVDHASKLGMLVTKVPDYCMEEVSDHAMALLLSSARRVAFFSKMTSSGEWDLKKGKPIPRLRGQTLGLLGYGHIGRTIAPKAIGFGMKVITYDPVLEPGPLGDSITAVADMETVLRESDYISIHLPLIESTRGLMNAKAFDLMKPTAFLINTSRGPVVDEKDLEKALKEGKIAGAALDVMVEEPPPSDHPLLSLPNFIATPHVAFYSEASIEELQRKAAGNVVQVLRGEVPEHVVNREVIEQDNYRLAAKQ